MLFDMTPTFKMEYDFGMIDKQTLASYVAAGNMCIDAAGYKEITGEDYVEPQTQTEPVAG
ncbi:MAG: XkdX family protein [Lactobacillus sp.]|jgi:hypothetical protein|nr:XkdX family protein [Lactobacillus sp.]MCH4067945.1 XkdX family protein [Lactobacillus sp.]MCI1303616.1 XkdX family protein [Lactobacillus sp.]MCI1329875.1 XkdX family protein [Lactobacillus sp.]MCI1359551.1 XkdX family protein [Lactobacillus sp.]